MLRDILDNFNDATATHAISGGINASQVARIARVQVATPIKTGVLDTDELISNWWLVTFDGLEPVQVAVWPPCNRAVVMALNSNAKSAIPIDSPI